MKFSSLTIFLILLILLVSTVLICRCYQSYSEGMAAYNYSADRGSSEKIVNYSNKNELNKIYDTIYFDNTNGSLVELDISTSYVLTPGTPAVAAVAATGTTAATPAVAAVAGTNNANTNSDEIQKLHILTRGSTSTSTYDIEDANTIISPAPETTMPNSMKSAIYNTIGTNSGNSYNVLVLPWHTNTYLHVMETSPGSAATTTPVSSGGKPKNMVTAALTYATSHTEYPYNHYVADPADASHTDDATAKQIAERTYNIESSYVDNDENNNKMVKEPMYNTTRKVYQISEYVKYDISNASLLICTGEGTGKEIKICKRGGNTETLSSPNLTGDNTHGDDDSVANTSFVPRIFHDMCGQNMILYIENAKKTLIALVNQNSDGDMSLRNVKRFTEKGEDTAEPDAGGDSDTDSEETDSTRESKYDYYDSIFNGTGSGVDSYALDRYMLKTQIVPPVCPACPSCNYGSGACGKCGGCGGAGTQDASGKSVVKDDTEKAPVKDAVGALGNVATGAVGAVGDVATGTVGAVGDVATGTVGAVGDVATGAVGAASNVATGTVGAVGNVATGVLGAVGNAASGAIDAVGNVVGSTVNAAGQVVPDGQRSAGTTNSVMGQQVQGGPITGNTGATDPYSYYGQLPSKPHGEYIPRTADFSNFSR
jgi:hypothetical protein